MYSKPLLLFFIFEKNTEEHRVQDRRSFMILGRLRLTQTELLNLLHEDKAAHRLQLEETKMLIIALQQVKLYTTLLKVRDQEEVADELSQNLRV